MYRTDGKERERERERGKGKAVIHSRCVKAASAPPLLCRLRPKATRVTAEQWNEATWCKKGGREKIDRQGEESMHTLDKREISVPIEFNKKPGVWEKEEKERKERICIDKS